MAAEAGTYVVGVTSDGRAHLTVRRANSTWRAFQDLQTLANESGPIAQVGMGGLTSDPGSVWFNVQVCVVTTAGRLLHARYDATDKWTPFGDVEGQAGERGSFRSVSAIGQPAIPEGPGPFDWLDVLATTSEGRLWQTARRPQGNWAPFADAESPHAEIGQVVTADLARGGVDPTRIGNIVAVSAAGGLWHAREIRTPEGTTRRSQFIDVETRAGERGDVVDASCAPAASANEALHLCVVTSDGGLWHTLRTGDFFLPFPPLADLGTWTPLSNVEVPAGERGRFVRVSCRLGTDGLHVCAVTDDGRVLYTRRLADGSWVQFQDIEAQAGARGDFVDVAMVAG